MRTGELVIGGVAIGLAVFVFVLTLGFPQLPDGHPGPGLFPQLLAIMLAIMGIALIGQNVSHGAYRPGGKGRVRRNGKHSVGCQRHLMLYVVIGIAGFIVAVFISWALMLRLGAAVERFVAASPSLCCILAF